MGTNIYVSLFAHDTLGNPKLPDNRLVPECTQTLYQSLSVLFCGNCRSLVFLSVTDLSATGTDVSTVTKLTRIFFYFTKTSLSVN